MVKVSNNIIIYSWETNHKNALWACKKFQIQISEIKYIALSPRLALDDEECFLVFIDKSFKFYKLPLFHTENVSEIINYFKLKVIGEDYNKYFSYQNHYGKVDKIIYPEVLFWKDLFHNDWKLFFRGFYSWILPNSFFGNIIDYDC